MAASSVLYQCNPSRCKARRPAGASGDEARAGDQSQNRQSAWPRTAAVSSDTRRRGDRVRRRADSLRYGDVGLGPDTDPAWASRAHRDRANAKVMKDPRLAKMMNPGALPFDGKRMIFGGFKVLIDT